MRGVAWGEGRFAKVASREKESERHPAVGDSGRGGRFWDGVPERAATVDSISIGEGAWVVSGDEAGSADG